MVGYASRHLKDLEGLTMEQAVDKIMTPHEIGEPVNNYYFELSAKNTRRNTVMMTLVQVNHLFLRLM